MYQNGLHHQALHTFELDKESVKRYPLSDCSTFYFVKYIYAHNTTFVPHVFDYIILLYFKVIMITIDFL